MMLTILTLLFVNPCDATMVILHHTAPILKRPDIQVTTFYEADEQKPFEGYRTHVYALHPITHRKYMFNDILNMTVPHIQHQWAVCWITQQYNESLMAEINAARDKENTPPRPSPPLRHQPDDSIEADELSVIYEEDELYDADEEEEKE
jgi:hypothetical protein